MGVVSIYLDGIEVLDEPVYNMAPPAGVPAELGFNAAGIGLIMHVVGQAAHRRDYGLSADISEIPEEHPIYGLELTLWGDPSDASHDAERGLCAEEEAKQSFMKTRYPRQLPRGKSSRPFLTMPASCTGEPLTTTMRSTRGRNRATLIPRYTRPERSAGGRSLPRRDGLRKARLQPETDGGIAEPAAASAESPTGLNVDLKVPQEESTRGWPRRT